MEGLGKWTGAALDQLAPLCMPWEESNGQFRPVFDRDAARLSLELAATAYDLDVDAWRQAGWTDMSYQVDNTLFTGDVLNHESGKSIGGIIGDYLQRLAKSRVNRLNPISQLRGALRQRESSDTCKAIVMMHALSGGQYLAAIGFMGTGKRIYDWFSNFRMGEAELAHQGFLELTREFENNCQQILFPETARQLNLEKLTLVDVLLECRRPSSRFRLWMAGHSQGGAVMQLFALRQVRDGFLRPHMIGYGFASPCALYGAGNLPLGSLPLYHIINSDDVTPRIGAMLHAGYCRVFHTDEELRRRCYPEVWEDEDFRQALSVVDWVRDTRDGLLWLCVLCEALEAVGDSEAVTSLSGLLGRILPDKLQGILGSRIDDVLRLVNAKAEEQYLALTGEAAAQNERVKYLRARMDSLIARCGSRRFMRVLFKAMSLPHRLRAREDEASFLGSYQYIVNERFDALVERNVWGGVAPRQYVRRENSRPAPRPGRRFARYTAVQTGRRRSAAAKRPLSP